MEIKRRRSLEWHFWTTPQRGDRRKFICFKLLIHLFSTEKLPSWSLELGLFTVKVDCRYEPDLIELQRIWILIQEVLITVDELRKRAGNFKASNFNNYKLRNAVRKILLLDNWCEECCNMYCINAIVSQGGGGALLYSSPPSLNPSSTCEIANNASLSCDQPILKLWNNNSKFADNAAHDREPLQLGNLLWNAIGREGNFSTLHLAGVNLANEMSLIDPDLMAQSLNKITSVTLFDSSVSVNQVWQSL